jgi:hypothetical protein
MDGRPIKAAAMAITDRILEVSSKAIRSDPDQESSPVRALQIVI